jgi:hypothetical protein
MMPTYQLDTVIDYGHECYLIKHYDRFEAIDENEAKEKALILRNKYHAETLIDGHSSDLYKVELVEAVRWRSEQKPIPASDAKPGRPAGFYPR